MTSGLAQETENEDPDRALLKKKGIESTAAGIIKHLKEISPTAEMIADVDKLIAQLGAESFRDRRAAQKKLQAMGQLAEAKVKAATKSKDPEIRDRAERILKSYDNYETEALLVACIRCLAKTDAGSEGVAVLLNAAPLYFHSYSADTAEKALLQIAKEGDLKVLLKATDDPKSAARHIAVIAAAKLLGAEKTGQLKKHLQDEDPKMRIATARAMANVGDRKAIDAFLALMEHKDTEIRNESFCYLQQFTRAGIPYSAYAKADERDLGLVKWKSWAAGAGKTAKLHFPLIVGVGGSFLNGHTLIAMGNGGKGAVELNREKKEVWSYPFQNCWAARKLANGNYLIGSHSERKLVEVTPKKKVVWEFAAKAMGVVQLRNGNVLAATHTDNSVVEIDKRQKKIVWQYNANANCFKAYRLQNGNTLVSGYKFIREITPKLKVVWEYTNGSYFYGIQPLPNGNIVVADHSNTVYELNRKKERVWEINEKSTTGAFKTSNGNVLVVTGGSVKEMTTTGEVKWTFNGNSYGFAHQ